MNRLSNVDKEIVQTDGNVVPDVLTTDAFLNGCSVTVKTIVAITAMKNRKIVLNVKIQISDVETIVVFQSERLFH